MRCATLAGNLLIGKPNTAIAIIGLPPIAKMSLTALVAAMRPKSKGSSTIGMKKSVVLIIDVPLPKSYTAASSLVSLPTRRFGSINGAISVCKISSKTLGDILQPQPAPWLYCVRRMSFVITHSFCSACKACSVMLTSFLLNEWRNYSVIGFRIH